MKSRYIELYYLLSNIVGKNSYHVINYERRTYDIIILGMGDNTHIYNISTGFYTDNRYNENATNTLIKDIRKIGNIAITAIPIIKRRDNHPQFERACSLCNNDANHKYSNGLFTCDICHSAFLDGQYGIADLQYYYMANARVRRTSGIYIINDDRIKLIYSHGNELFEHMTIRIDKLYTNYNAHKIRNEEYCDLCAINKITMNDTQILCDICKKILGEYRWKQVLPFIFIIMYKLDNKCDIKLCLDVKRYCLRFILFSRI